MRTGDIEGLDYATGQLVRLTIQDGTIIAKTPLEPRPGHAHRWLAPGLFDVQVNGYAGIDFQRDDLSLEELLQAARGLRRDGCTRFFFTLITADWPAMIRRLTHARRLREQSPELRRAIAGWHIEGPFLSPEPGFRGAHNSDVMLDPKAEHIRELRSVTETDPVLLTLAPERAGALEAIRLATSLGMVVSLGHTNAPAATVRSAVEAGATGFTHLANGCPRELDRHDNIVWRVCDFPGLTVSLIPDAIHVSPAPFRLLHRMLADRPIFYTTDAMAAAGAPPGRYRIGSIDVEVGADQVVRQPGQTNFAGSALRPDQGPFRAAQMLGVPWQVCWRTMSEAPATFSGLDNKIEVGAPADFCMLEVDAAGGLKELQTW